MTPLVRRGTARRLGLRLPDTSNYPKRRWVRLPGDPWSWGPGTLGHGSKSTMGTVHMGETRLA